MKNLVICSLLISVYLFAPLPLFPKQTIAHSGPPFIKVNDQTNQPNPAGSGSVFFKVPNEVAAQNYVINDTIRFSVDTALLPVDPTLIKSSDFLWEFGNSKTATGLNSTTTYTKSGSYVVILKVKDPNYQDPIELESMQINILPNKSSKPPVAKIKINGKTIKDPFKEPFLIDKNSEVKLDAGDSEGDIKSYKWDLADGSKLVEGKQVKHKFDFSKPYAYSFFPILRVEDKNGVYHDTIVQIANEESSTTNSATNSTDSKQSLLLPTAFISLALFSFIGVGYLVLKNRQAKK